jgi:hypothetical protein
MGWQVAKSESSGHFKKHLAVASRGHGVFKGVMKRRKTPGEWEEEGEGSQYCQRIVMRGWDFALTGFAVCEA